MAHYGPPAAAVLLALGVLYGDLLLAPASRGLGGPGTEAPGHALGLWLTTLGLFEHGPFLRHADLAWPEGLHEHLMDPVNLLVFAPVYRLAGGGADGAMLAWNMLHVAMTLAAAAGTWALGTRILSASRSRPWAIAVGIVIVCVSAFAVGHPIQGRSEFLPAALLPGQLAALHAWLAPGPARWRAGLLAGVLLGLAALGGWYLAVFLLVVEIPVALALAVRLPIRAALGRLAFVAALALALVAPALAALLDAPPAAFGPAGPGERVPVQLLAPSFRVVTEAMVGREPAAYPGIVAFVLAFGALLVRPRRAWGWVLLGVWVLAWGLGPRGMWLPEGTEWPLPAELPWRLVPQMRTLKVWSRIGCLVAVPFAVAAMIAVDAAGERRVRWLAPLASGAVLLDVLTFPVAWTWARPSHDLTMPAELGTALERLPPGPVLSLPFDAPSKGFGKDELGKHLFWQPQHGRPVTSSNGGSRDEVLRRSSFAQLAFAVQTRTGAATPAARACARVDAVRLGASGLAGLYVYRLLPGGAEVAAFVEKVLGPALAIEGEAQVWAMPASAPEPRQPCPEVTEAGGPGPGGSAPRTGGGPPARGGPGP